MTTHQDIALQIYYLCYRHFPGQEILQAQASYCQGRGGRQKWLGISRIKISNQGDIR
jgi:hypothetical protein